MKKFLTCALLLGGMLAGGGLATANAAENNGGPSVEAGYQLPIPGHDHHGFEAGYVGAGYGSGNLKGALDIGFRGSYGVDNDRLAPEHIAFLRGHAEYSLTDGVVLGAHVDRFLGDELRVASYKGHYLEKYSTVFGPELSLRVSGPVSATFGYDSYSGKYANPRHDVIAGLNYKLQDVTFKAQYHSDGLDYKKRGLFLVGVDVGIGL